MSLRRRLADHGFDSNDDYDFALACLFGPPPGRLRVLHVDGAEGRRKTAFAQAVGGALGYAHRLYHDFSISDSPAPALTVKLDDGSEAPAEPPLPGFERALVEACAYAESEPTVLVLDQLQHADFARQQALHHFVRHGDWLGAGGPVAGHPERLLVVLVSEAPLYHPLAQCAFRVWTDAQRAWAGWTPQEFGLGVEAGALFEALAALFEAAGAAPTSREFRLLLDDLAQRVRSTDHLRHALFGRIETMDRARLHAPECAAALDRVLLELERLLVSERIELGD
jgi:hypothetical protein